MGEGETAPLTCLFVGDFHRVRFERHEGGAAALVERRDLHEQLDAGLEVADAQVRVPAGLVVQEQRRLRVEDLELELLRVAAVEARPAPDLDRVGRLVHHGAVARRVGSHFIAKQTALIERLRWLARWLPPRKTR